MSSKKKLSQIQEINRRKLKIMKEIDILKDERLELELKMDDNKKYKLMETSSAQIEYGEKLLTLLTDVLEKKDAIKFHLYKNLIPQTQSENSFQLDLSPSSQMMLKEILRTCKETNFKEIHNLMDGDKFREDCQALEHTYATFFVDSLKKLTDIKSILKKSESD